MCSVCGQLSGSCQEVQAQAVSERASVSWSAYVFGLQPWSVQVDPHLGLLGSPRGQCFSSGGQSECCVVVLDCQTGGLVVQESDNKSLRTQARLRFLGEAMAGTIYRPESRSRASEVRARIRRSLRLEFLSLMAPS